MLWAAGDATYDLVVLLEGRAEIAEGWGRPDERVLFRFGPSEFLGEFGLLTGKRVALTAVNPAPVLVKKASEVLQGKRLDEELAELVGDLAAKTAKPLTTSALTPEYRREMIRVFTKRALLALAN